MSASVDRKSAAAYNNRGDAWSNKKEYDKAIYDYNEAIQIVPNFEMAYGNRGEAWSHKKEYGKAVSDYDEASRLDPKNAYRWNASDGLLQLVPMQNIGTGKPQLMMPRKLAS